MVELVRRDSPPYESLPMYDKMKQGAHAGLTKSYKVLYNAGNTFSSSVS